MAIQILEPHVIDQIAAGEVVERPAHLVKELVENALDAGATEVTVEFSNGGRNVKVIDNGRGMTDEDLPLAIARHATSKIQKTDDLFNLSSYGFRGEALASIGAVSKLTIESRATYAEHGHRIKVDSGSVSPMETVGRAVGTMVDVADLFENVPARLKFLKSARHESAQIKNMLKAMALANPHVTFRVKADGEWAGIYPAVPDFVKRSGIVLEEPELFYGEHEIDSFKCRVAVSSPDRTVGQSKQIWIFVQGRWVQDRALQAAVMDAYRNLLMHGEYPIAVISLTCDPSEVDVNVSPNKSQVKFVNSSNAYRAVHHAVRNILESAPWLGNLKSATPPYQEGLQAVAGTSMPSTSSRVNAPEPQTQSFGAAEFNTTNFKRRDYDALVTQKNAEPSHGLSLDSMRAAVESVPAVAFAWKNVSVIGQARLTYILCEGDDGLIVVDQHAAHERVLFERLMRGFREGGLEIQNYLLPLTVPMPEEFVAVLLSSAQELERAGLHVDQMGPSTLAVTAGPAILSDESVAKALQKLAQEYVERGGSFHFEKVVGDLMATAACHSAVRAGQALGHEEMKSLLVQMDEFPLSGFCPHGRPVYVRWPIREMERDFGRIV